VLREADTALCVLRLSSAPTLFTNKKGRPNRDSHFDLIFFSHFIGAFNPRTELGQVQNARYKATSNQLPAFFLSPFSFKVPERSEWDQLSASLLSAFSFLAFS